MIVHGPGKNISEPCGISLWKFIAFGGFCFDCTVEILEENLGLDEGIRCIVCVFRQV